MKKLTVDEFHIGDRVQLVKAQHRWMIGAVGVIVWIEGNDITVAPENGIKFVAPTEQLKKVS